MSRNNASDSDWHDSEAELPANLRNRLLYKQLNMSNTNKPTLWENIKDLILVIALLVLFTTPIWMPAAGCTTP